MLRCRGIRFGRIRRVAVIELRMISSRGRSRGFRLRNDRTVIGRSVQCDVRITLPSVEGQHCQIDFAGDVMSLRPLKPGANTRLNGVHIERPVGLRIGDRIGIGSVEFELSTVEHPEETHRPEIEAKPIQDGRGLSLGRPAPSRRDIRAG